jgi:DNA-binding response OmpR family regulator
MGHDGDEAVRALLVEPPALVILDLMVPGRSGLDVCREIRARLGPQPVVLMLTARIAEEDAVLGFDVGADDYVRKPFRVAELMARIGALLRRTAEHPGAPPATSAAAHRAGLAIDAAARRASVAGREVRLTPMEFDLLCHLARCPGQVLSRRQLLEEVWGYQHEGYARTIDTHVTRLRRKLAAAGLAGDPIATVHGRGYRFGDDEDA